MNVTTPPLQGALIQQLRAFVITDNALDFIFGT